MAASDKKYTSLIVYNSITNKLGDEKYDTQKPFTFVEYLKYIVTLDNNDLDNLNQYKVYLKNWDSSTFESKKNIKINVKDIYINFFNSLTLSYSTAEERRFFENIDINDDTSLSQAIPFYSNKIKEVIEYYRERRSTYKKELREIKNKGSNESVKNLIKNTVINYFQSANLQSSELFALSSTFLDLKIELEEGYDTFNDYFDIDPSTTSVSARNTFETNKINYNALLDFNQALIDVVNENKITLKELAPFNLTVTFNRVFSEYYNNEDFVDYDRNNQVNSNFNIFEEAELSKKFTGTDYYYISTNETAFVSGSLFKAEDEVSNILNINYPSFRSNINEDTIFEREVGLYYAPTKFSLLRVDGEYTQKIKLDLEKNNVYIFPDPNKYGDIVNVSTSKRLNPYNFYFKNSTFKNVSSSYGRKIPKGDQRSHYFHSYQSKDNRVYNLNNDSALEKNYENLHNFGYITKNESDIYGNEFVSFIKYPFVTRNIKVNYDYKEGVPFNSGLTIDYSENKYGVEKYVQTPLEKQQFKKHVYLNNVSNNTFLPLSSSGFKIIIDKLSNNTQLQNEVNTNILDINVYGDVYSIKTSGYNVIDGFKLKSNTAETSAMPAYSNIPTQPFILEKEDNQLSFISNDCVVDDVIFKVAITPVNALTGFSNQFYFKFYSYDTVAKKENIIHNETNTVSSFFSDNFYFLDNVIFKSVKNSFLTFNSKNDEFILTTTFGDKSNSPIIHLLKYKIFQNNVTVKNNILYRDKNLFSPKHNITGNKFTALSADYVSLTSNNDVFGVPFLDQSTTGNLTRTLMFYEEAL